MAPPAFQTGSTWAASGANTKIKRTIRILGVTRVYIAVKTLVLLMHAVGVPPALAAIG